MEEKYARTEAGLKRECLKCFCSTNWYQPHQHPASCQGFMPSFACLTFSVILNFQPASVKKHWSVSLLCKKHTIHIHII